MHSEYVAQLELSPHSFGRDRTWLLVVEDMLDISAGPITSHNGRVNGMRARTK